MEYDHLESTKHHNDEHVVTSAISTAYAYVRTVTYKTWEHANLLQIAAGEALQVAVPHPQVLGYADSDNLGTDPSVRLYGMLKRAILDG